MALPSPHVRVSIDLDRIRRNVSEIRSNTGVPVIAVIKADAYGLGAIQIAPAIADLVDEFCVFSPQEAKDIALWEKTGKSAIAIGPPIWADSSEYIVHHVRPAVSSPWQLAKYRQANPVLCVDTGQQRFACDPDDVPAMLREGHVEEAFTHTTTLRQVEVFKQAVGGRVPRLHAAGSSLLGQPEAWLSAVRPGLAIYHGAVRVHTPLVETHKSRGPAGYTGFRVPWHGVILAGYSNGLRPGPCMMNGRSTRILEVGMQSAFVQVTEQDEAQSEVVLLGEGLSEHDVATDWGVTPHEVLFRLASCGIKSYHGG